MVAIKQVPVESDLQEIIKEISIMQQCDRSRHYTDKLLFILHNLHQASFILNCHKFFHTPMLSHVRSNTGFSYGGSSVVFALKKALF